MQSRIDNENFIVAGETFPWDNLADFLSENINETIPFLENECTPEEIYWTAEVFDMVAKKTQSKEFIAALHRIYDKMPEEVKKSIKVDIEFAELALE